MRSSTAFVCCCLWLVNAVELYTYDPICFPTELNDSVEQNTLIDDDSFDPLKVPIFTELAPLPDDPSFRVMSYREFKTMVENPADHDGYLVQLTSTGNHPVLIVQGHRQSLSSLEKLMSSINAMQTSRLRFLSQVGLLDRFVQCAGTVGPIYLAAFENQPTDISPTIFLNQVTFVRRSLEYISRQLRTRIVQDEQPNGNTHPRPRVVLVGYSMGGFVAANVAVHWLVDMVRSCTTTNGGILMPVDCEEGFPARWPYDIITTLTVSSPLLQPPKPLGLAWEAIYRDVALHMKEVEKTLLLDWYHMLPFFVHFCGGQSDPHLNCVLSGWGSIFDPLGSKFSLQYPMLDILGITIRADEAEAYDPLQDVDFLHRIFSPAIMYIAQLDMFKSYLGVNWKRQFTRPKDMSYVIYGLLFNLLHDRIAEPVSVAQGERSYNFAYMAKRWHRKEHDSIEEFYHEHLRVIRTLFPSDAMGSIHMEKHNPLEVLARLFRLVPDKMRREVMWGNRIPFVPVSVLDKSLPELNVSHTTLEERSIDIDLSTGSFFTLSNLPERIISSPHALQVIQIPVHAFADSAGRSLGRKRTLLTVGALADPEVDSLLVYWVYGNFGTLDGRRHGKLLRMESLENYSNTVRYPSGRKEQLRMFLGFFPLPAGIEQVSLGTNNSVGLAFQTLTTSPVYMSLRMSLGDYAAQDWITRNLKPWGYWPIMTVTSATRWKVPTFGQDVETLEDNRWQPLRLHSHNYAFMINTEGRVSLPGLNSCTWQWSDADSPLVRECSMTFRPRRERESLSDWTLLTRERWVTGLQSRAEMEQLQANSIYISSHPTDDPEPLPPYDNSTVGRPLDTTRRIQMYESRAREDVGTTLTYVIRGQWLPLLTYSMLFTLFLLGFNRVAMAYCSRQTFVPTHTSLVAPSRDIQHISRGALTALAYVLFPPRKPGVLSLLAQTWRRVWPILVICCLWICLFSSLHHLHHPATNEDSGVAVEYGVRDLFEDLSGAAVFGLVLLLCAVTYSVICLVGLLGTMLAFVCWNSVSFVGCCGTLSKWTYPRKGTWLRTLFIGFLVCLGSAFTLFLLFLMPTLAIVFSTIGIVILLMIHNILKVSHSPPEGADPAAPQVRQLVTPRLWTLQRTSILLETALFIGLSIYGSLHLWTQVYVGLPARFGYANFLVGLWATGPRMIYRPDFSTWLLTCGALVDLYIVPFSAVILVIIHCCHYARRREVQFQIRRLERARRKTVSALQFMEAARGVSALDAQSSDLFASIAPSDRQHAEITTTASEVSKSNSFALRLNKAALGADRDRNVCATVGVLLCLTGVSGLYCVRLVSLNIILVFAVVGVMLMSGMEMYMTILR